MHPMRRFPAVIGLTVVSFLGLPVQAQDLQPYRRSESINTTLPPPPVQAYREPATINTTLPQCKTGADCDDHDPCTADSCYNGACQYMAICASAEAPPPPPGTPSDPVAYAACLKVCKDEPCWKASCTPDGKCQKMATCVSAPAPTYTPTPSVKLAPGGIRVPYSPATPSTPATPASPSTPSTPPVTTNPVTPPSPPGSGTPPPPPPPPPPPLPAPSPVPTPSAVPPPPASRVPPIGEREPKPGEIVERPMRRCEDLGEMKACCLKYDDPARGGNADGYPDKMELARIVQDESCRPKETAPTASGGAPMAGDLCANLANIMVGEGAKVTLNGFQQCCQSVRNLGDAENVTVRQNCENVGEEGATEAAGAEAAASAAKAQALSETEKDASDDGGGCGLLPLP